jgi:tRNA pseudouridine55 synthase
MDGLLLIDKPLGWTSHDVVAKVRGILKHSGTSKPKVGHTGTLDPQATGLLILVIGSYCKRAQELSKLDKTYEVSMCLGQTSTTGDAEGEKTPVSSHAPSEEEVKQALEQFSGVIEQVPPAYSAIKVGGKRSYQLAREGKAVELTARTVTIYSIEDVTYKYPALSFTVSVSSGTYIRSLVQDMGVTLGTGAYTTSLRRTRVGKYTLAHAAELPDLTSENIADYLRSA